MFKLHTPGGIIITVVKEYLPKSQSYMPATADQGTAYGPDHTWVYPGWSGLIWRDLWLM